MDEKFFYDTILPETETPSTSIILLKSKDKEYIHPELDLYNNLKKIIEIINSDSFTMSGGSSNTKNIENKTENKIKIIKLFELYYLIKIKNDDDDDDDDDNAKLEIEDLYQNGIFDNLVEINKIIKLATSIISSKKYDKYNKYKIEEIDKENKPNLKDDTDLKNLIQHTKLIHKTIDENLLKYLYVENLRYCKQLKLKLNPTPTPNPNPNPNPNNFEELYENIEGLYKNIQDDSLNKKYEEIVKKLEKIKELKSNISKSRPQSGGSNIKENLKKTINDLFEQIVPEFKQEEGDKQSKAYIKSLKNKSDRILIITSDDELINSLKDNYTQIKKTHGQLSMMFKNDKLNPTSDTNSEFIKNIKIHKQFINTDIVKINKNNFDNLLSIKNSDIKKSDDHIHKLGDIIFYDNDYSIL